MINKAIKALVGYGIHTGLISEADRIYISNQILEVIKMDEYEEPTDTELENEDLEQILKIILDYAADNGVIELNTIDYRDLFDTKIMGLLVPRPSQIVSKFKELYKKAPEIATDYYYKLSQDSDYIRRYRILKDIRWVTKTQFGDIDITINLSKPEKDPKAIAAAKLMKQSGYPKCLLCKENEGYAGRLNHPARQNHRIIPIRMNNQDWGFQYSPYVYYNEHCIIFNFEHTPMKINKETFIKLFDFVKLFPHYFIGSNADLPIVGGSILTHDHFQGGNYSFAMAKAPVEGEFTIKGYESVTCGIVNWPMSVIRLKAKEETVLIDLGDYILHKWRNYTDAEAFVYAFSLESLSDEKDTLLTDSNIDYDNLIKGVIPHNTITPIARKIGDWYELDLVLRNNITTKEHPFGVYHPHDELHNIKKENIGLIEVMGLAVLPSRLKEEMELVKEFILQQKDLETNPLIQKHKTWVNGFKGKYDSIDKDNIDDIVKEEIGLVFSKVLEHAGVFKRDEEGQKFFGRFIDVL
ncbi:MAG: UTP-hexose-phosphate uridylyltransferase [Anaerocolumna sp.]|nr:UTP-hexose-phosphate uridylyltransferase [Anaerocolumna sp.]